MTLEDFFTLTEMKDGLTVPARVKELVNIMQQEKNNIVRNVGDAARQWSTVASTIAATENKDCLDLFLQLDGLGYIDCWLKDAQKFGNQTGDSFVEESITALLGAIGKLHTDAQKPVNSGILMTVKSLHGYSSSKVQNKARILFDSWEQVNSRVLASQDASKLEAGCENQTNASASPGAELKHPECSSHDISPSGGSDNEGKKVDARDKMMDLTYSESNNQKGVDDINIQTSDRTLDHAAMKDRLPDSLCFSDMLKPVSDISSVQENTKIYGSEIITGSSGFAVPKQTTLEGQRDVSNSNDNDDAKQMQQTRSCDKSDAMYNSFSVDFKNALESKVDTDVDEIVEAKEASSSGNVGIDVSEEKDAMGDTKSVNPCRKTLESKPSNESHDSSADVLQNKMEHKLEVCEELATKSSRTEDTGVIEEFAEQHTDEAEVDLCNGLELSRSAVESKDSDIIDERSVIEMDDGTVDPLEVARQVAIEVKRQVDCRDKSCSSSERTSGGGIRLSKNPDSIGKKGQVVYGQSKDVPTGPNLSVVSGNGAFITAKNLIAEHESHVSDMSATQFGRAVLKTEPNTDEHICGFDLNEELLSDDMEHSISPLAAPLSFVSASRPAASTGSPDAPLQFEGNLGWKGSAETSAFRPAPPRRISESEKPLVASASHDISEQRQNYLDFDLNVAEREDDKITDLMLGKEIPNSSVRPSGDSFVEVSPKRSDRLQLDLNCVSDIDDAQPHWRREGMHLQHWNGHHSPSPSSSSSSVQPTLRNIDLNDQPSILNEFSDPAFFGKSSQSLSTIGGFKAGDSVVSIMGAKVETNRKEFVSQTIPFPNGRISDHAVDTSSTRIGSVLGMGSTLPYAPAPVYGYNVPPSRPTMPFSSTMYGLGVHIPYMVDSRGSHAVPQILGSASAIPPVFSQPPFIISMEGTPTGSNGVGPLRNNFDLNTGLMVDGGNKNAGGLRHLVNSGQGRPLDDHLRANPPTSTSDVGGKRKGTDGGWEHFPFNYKHHRPPCK